MTEAAQDGAALDQAQDANAAINTQAAGDASASNAAANLSDALNAAPVVIAAEIHEEAKGIFASLTEKLVNFEHALAADAKAELEKLKTLLHL